MIAEKPEVKGGGAGTLTRPVDVPPTRRAGEPLPPPRPGGNGTANAPRQSRRKPPAAWGKRQTALLVGASFAVTLLCLYVSAYARVTAEGFETSRLTRQLNAAVKEEEGLRASRDRLKLPETVRQRAEGLNMVRGNATTLYFLTGEGKARADALSAREGE
jgi:hypothetical protein